MKFNVPPPNVLELTAVVTPMELLAVDSLPKLVPIGEPMAARGFTIFVGSIPCKVTSCCTVA
jgi:hypothetical protein